MKKRIKSILLVSLLSIGFLFSVQPVRSKALNASMTIGTMTQATWNSMQTWLKANKSDWFQNYDYIIYENSGYAYTIKLVKKGNAKLVFADNQIDSPYQEDIDKWYMYEECSVANPEYLIRFNSSGTYVKTDTYTVCGVYTEITSTTVYKMFYTNWLGYTYLSYVTGNQTTTQTNISLRTFGLNPLPTNWIPDYVTQTTDQEQTDQLILQFEILGVKFEMNMQGLVDAIKGLEAFLDPDAWMDAFNLVFNPLGSGISNLYNAFVDFSGQFVAFVVDFIPAWTDFSGKVIAIIVYFLNLIPYIFTRLIQFMLNTGTDVINGIAVTLNIVKGSMNLLFNYLPSPFNNLLSSAFAIVMGSSLVSMAWYFASFGRSS